MRWTQESIIFQGAQHALDPVIRVGDQIERGRSSRTTWPRGARRRVRAGELLERVGLPPRRARRLPARVLGRSEATRHDRDGARLRPRPRDRGRAHHGARRDGAGAGAAAAAGRSSATSGSRCSSSRTTFRCSSTSRDRLAVMYAGRVVEEGPADAGLQATRSTRTRRRSRRRSPTIGDERFIQAPAGLDGDPPDPRGAAERMHLPPALRGGVRRRARGSTRLFDAGREWPAGRVPPAGHGPRARPRRGGPAP